MANKVPADIDIERVKDEAREIASNIVVPLGTISNCIAETNDKDKVEWHALTMSQVLADVRAKTRGWPKRTGQSLFVDDKTLGLGFLRDEAGCFGWLANTIGPVVWKYPPGAVTQAQVFAELGRTSQEYATIENLPHEPPIDGHYYSLQSFDFTAGSGKRLYELVDRFSPETEADRELMVAALVTPGWGGAAGCRPVFVITSDEGRGTGKTTFARLVGEVWGGVFSAEPKEDIQKLKTRLLSHSSLTNRVALCDNIKSNRFSSPELEALITAATINGHQMYSGDGSRPNVLTWFITLNGASLSTDMAQRAIVIKLRKPTRTATWLEDTQQFIRDHRRELIGDCVGWLRRPATNLDQPTRWASWERDVLSRVNNPNAIQNIIRDRQAVADVEADEIGIIEDYFASQLEQFGYDVARERVFIPSAIATRWFNIATNEKKSAVAVGRILNQYASERHGSIAASPGRAHGRGFIWQTVSANIDRPIMTDLESKFKVRDPGQYQTNFALNGEACSA